MLIYKHNMTFLNDIKANVLVKSISAAYSLLLLSVPVQAASINQEQWNMIDGYCVECHNLEDFSGGLAFDLLDGDEVHNDAKLWEEVVRKLRGGMMPPPGQPRPGSAQLNNFIGSLENTLDTVALENPNPGSPSLHRLNRYEYSNAVRDLLGVEVNANDFLPVDDSSSGFDNIANVLNVSPALMQAYVSAAAKVSRLAVGDMTSSPMLSSYSSGGTSQAKHIAGLPLGTRGGLFAEHVFPLDAEYQINVRSSGNGLFAFPSVANDEPIEISLDGERIDVIPSGSPADITLFIPAGPHTIAATFLNTQPEKGVHDIFQEKAETTSIDELTITGPLNVSGPGRTPSRNKIFVCRPERVEEQRPCAEKILGTLASRAYRHPVDDDSLDILMDFYESGSQLRDFETGIQYAVARILVDPQFIYRFEKESVTLREGDIYEIDDYELASRLSFFIWSSIPDDELLLLASEGNLSNLEVLQQQVDRMLDDEKSNALVENFATQWLSLRGLDIINPTSTDYDGTLRESMKQETLLLFDSILRENRSVLDLLNANYTFVDERLAKHYGIDNIRGSRFRRVNLSDESRYGLLGHASILTLTSAPNRTSPVIRGTWILENILGTPPPPPPPGVETNLEETAAVGQEPTTIRQRLEMHRADPSCNSCHGMIDPIGFALENFDSIGKWRDTIGKDKVNTQTEMWDGTQLNGPVSLREALLKKSDNFIATTTEKLMTYALGRKVEYYDMPALRKIVRDASSQDHSLSSLIKGIVLSPAFRMRQKQYLDIAVENHD